MSRHSLVGRSMRGITALAVATLLAGGMHVTPAMAAAPDAQPPNVSTASEQAQQESTTDQKAAAARTASIPFRPEMAGMRDVNFVIMIWRDVPADFANIKRDAAAAFSSDDPNACYAFITSGIEVSWEKDRVALGETAKEYERRQKAAQRIGWSPVAKTDLDLSLRDFVFKLWQKADAAGITEVKNAANAVLTDTSTDAQRQTFVTTGIFTAYDAYAQRQKEESERKDAELREKEANYKARQDAWRVVARAALTDELEGLTNHEFVYAAWNRTEDTRKHVKSTSRAALDSGDAAKLKAWIFTGVHAAHQADLKDQDEADARRTAEAIRKIIDDAKLDRYKPKLVAAAEAALAGTLAERNAFLNIGQHEAAKLDWIAPAHEKVVELVGVASKRCIQVAGVNEQPFEHGQYQEYWDCARGSKQVYALLAVREGVFMARNAHSIKCLDGHQDILRQYDCDINNANHHWKFIQNAADGTYQLQNVANGKFITSKEGGTGNGTQLAMAGHNNDGHQRFRLIDPVHRADVAQVQAGTARIKGVHSGRCMQVAGWFERPTDDAFQNLAAMELWDCVGGNKMTWTIIDLGNKKFALKNALSGKCLDVKWGNFNVNTPWIQFDCHFAGTQQFVFVPGGNNSYVLENVLTGKAADAHGFNSHNGAVVTSWDVNFYENQRWTIENQCGAQFCAQPRPRPVNP